MQVAAHRLILDRTGLVLIGVGVIDIGLMIYCIARGMSYSSSFNIFAVVAGIFLMRGSLRAVAIVRGMAVLLLAAMAGMLVAWPLLQPMDLTLTQMRLETSTFAISVLTMVLAVALLLWLCRQLLRPAVVAAQLEAGMKRPRTRLLSLLGLGSTLALAIGLQLMLNGDTAAIARQRAADQLGPHYRYHVASLNYQMSGAGNSVQGVVIAWNEHEIVNVPVAWTEP